MKEINFFNKTIFCGENNSSLVSTTSVVDVSVEMDVPMNSTNKNSTTINRLKF